jgi:hypothetical protein
VVSIAEPFITESLNANGAWKKTLRSSTSSMPYLSVEQKPKRKKQILLLGLEILKLLHFFFLTGGVAPIF